MKTTTMSEGGRYGHDGSQIVTSGSRANGLLHGMAGRQRYTVRLTFVVAYEQRHAQERPRAPLRG